MKKLVRGIRDVFIYLRLLPVLIFVDWKNNKFSSDLLRWKQICHMEGPDIVVLARLLWFKKEFRNLFIYRNSHRRIYRYWIAFWYRPMDTLFIETSEIGGGLFIQHGFATMIAAKSIGENCWINQQVTIGYHNFKMNIFKLGSSGSAKGIMAYTAIGGTSLQILDSTSSLNR